MEELTYYEGLRKEGRTFLKLDGFTPFELTVDEGCLCLFVYETLVARLDSGQLFKLLHLQRALDAADNKEAL